MGSPGVEAETPPAAVERYTVCVWRTTTRGEESVLWYSGPFAVDLDSRPDRLVITVRRSPGAEGVTDGVV
jgi:hypothetical protein